MSARVFLVGLLWLAGCAVTEHQYPLTWDPVFPAASGDCRHLQGFFADRGEMAQSPSQPSLTYALFGHHSPWRSAQRVQFALPDEGTLSVTVWDADKALVTRSFTAKAGELACKAGRLVVRSRRWMAADIVAGREDVTMELSEAGNRLVAHVTQATYGTMFAVVPLAGTATHWYRFPRVKP